MKTTMFAILKITMMVTSVTAMSDPTALGGGWNMLTLPTCPSKAGGFADYYYTGTYCLGQHLYFCNQPYEVARVYEYCRNGCVTNPPGVADQCRAEYPSYPALPTYPGQGGGRGCCYAMTAECLACAQGISEEQYCRQDPSAIGCSGSPSFPAYPTYPALPTYPGQGGGRGCCYAMTAECLACAQGISEEQYCWQDPSAIGCGSFPAYPTYPALPTYPGQGGGRGCCYAMTAECLACAQGISEEQYCWQDPSAIGCGSFPAYPAYPTYPALPTYPGQGGGRGCCYAMTAECLACAQGISEEQYCWQDPSAIGCSGSPYYPYYPASPVYQIN